MQKNELRMSVTLNPFVELYDSSRNKYFAYWRGDWNPSGSVATTFWSDYTDYLMEVANLASKYNVDGMGVGTELKSIVVDSSHNERWDAVIKAVDEVYDGPLHYAANWDHFASGEPEKENVTYIFDRPAIDYVGVDSYFTNLISRSEAALDQRYPDAPFIALVESAWNDLLDNKLLPYAASRGGGKALLFTEFGHLPLNGTSVDPQNQDTEFQPPIEDKDEQLMAFEGFFNALDGRQDAVPAVHIWQWEMAGSNGSLWNINPGLRPDQPHNDDISDWLVDFVSTATTVLEGDFNADGDVDGNDFLAWQAGFGMQSGAQKSDGDYDNDGDVDGNDFLGWQSEFGSGGGSVSAAVPEPVSIALALVMVAAILSLRQAETTRP